MSALLDVQSRMRAALAAFETRHSTPLSGDACAEIHDLLVRFADEILVASETDGQDIDAVSFDDLLSSISYFQDRVIETQAA